MNKQVMALTLSGLLLVSPTYDGAANSATIVEFDKQVENMNIMPFTNPRLIAFQNQVQKDLEEMTIKKEAEKAEQERIEQERRERDRIEHVWFNSYDLRDPSGISFDEMKEVLSESHYSNFTELSDAFVGAEKEYGVNAFGLVAIAGLESGWNRSDRAKNGSNNLTGMAVYEDGSIGTQYKSKYDCIMDLARQLSIYYLTPGAEYYNGVSTSKVNIKYSASSDWHKKVDAIGDELVAIYNQKFRNGGTY